MRRRMTFLICGLAVCGAWVLPVAAEDKVDNPMYTHWAQFKPGSFSVFKADNVINGIRDVTAMTVTLVEITPEKAVIEKKYVSAVTMDKIDMPVQREEIPAKIEAKELAKEIGLPKQGADWKGGKVADVAQGREEIRVGDRKFKANWSETTIRTRDQGTATCKIWRSEKVPGQVLKLSSSFDGRTSISSEGVLMHFKADRVDKAGDADKLAAADAGRKAGRTDVPEKPQAAVKPDMVGDIARKDLSPAK